MKQFDKIKMVYKYEEEMENINNNIYNNIDDNYILYSLCL